MMMNPDDLMSPTTRLAQLDHLSPVEDLDLDEVDVSLMSEEEETPKTTTPVGGSSGLVADKCGLFDMHVDVLQESERETPTGASALLSLTGKSASQNHIELVEATQTNQTVAQSATPTLRTPRSLEMRLAMNNDILGDEDLMNCECF